MAKYSIHFKASAEKEFNNLDKVTSERIEAKIDLLENNPYLPGSKKLQGESSLRLRVGDYRIIYEVNETNKTVMVFKIGHRSKIYKNL